MLNHKLRLFRSPQLQQVCMLNHNSTRASLHYAAEYVAPQAIVKKITLHISAILQASSLNLLV